MNEVGRASKQHGSPWPPPPGGRRRGMVRAVSLPLGFARLTAIHAALPGWARRMPRHSAKFMAAALFVLSAFSASPVWAQATLGNLAPGSFQSGVGVISCWVCEAERIDIVFNPGTATEETWRAGCRTTRPDTAFSASQTDGLCARIHKATFDEVFKCGLRPPRPPKRSLFCPVNRRDL